MSRATASHSLAPPTPESCGADMLPHGVRAVGSSPEFTASTVPAALLQRHATAEGCWAQLCVSSGTLLYTDLAAGTEQRLAGGQQVVVPPAVPHRVHSFGDVSQDAAIDALVAVVRRGFLGLDLA